MNRRTVAIATVLFLVDVACFVAFAIVRPADTTYLNQRDVASGSGSEVFEYTGHPSTYIAARPLYGWNSWHGGEESWVKPLRVMSSFVVPDRTVLHPVDERARIFHSEELFLSRL